MMMMMLEVQARMTASVASAQAAAICCAVSHALLPFICAVYGHRFPRFQKENGSVQSVARRMGMCLMKTMTTASRAVMLVTSSVATRARAPFILSVQTRPCLPSLKATGLAKDA
jgi:hypothetical protein